MLKRNSKGFTLVELLAVIVIMGILMMVAIPAVTRTIENSRKESFVDIAKSYGNAARTLWTSDNLTCDGVLSSAVDDGDYYILINSKEGAKETLPVLVEQGGKSSWGNRDVNGYVRVNISTTVGEDINSDGVYEVEPRRVTKFYVALSDGTHGVLDDDTLLMDELKRGNVNMNLSEENLKKIELTVNDGRLDCGKTVTGRYSCVDVKPIKKITGVCVDDQTNVGLTGNVAVPSSFATDDWDTIVDAIIRGTHPYSVGDTRQIDMGDFGIHTVRLANLSTPAECSTEGFSQTACGTVIEFADNITRYSFQPYLNEEGFPIFTNAGGWPATKLITYLNNDIYNALPAELRSVIIDTKVVSGHGSTPGEVNFVSNDKLYLLSTAEIWEQGTSNIINNDTARDSTRQLDYYLGVTTDNYSKAVKHGAGVSWWWLRTALSSDATDFYYVRETGTWGEYVSYYGHGVSPAFRIG